MLVRFISAGIALATMAFGSAVCADELPAPKIRKTKRPAIQKALRPASSRPARTAPQRKDVAELRAIDLGTPKRLVPVAMEGPSEAYRALERRIYGRSRGNAATRTARKAKPEPAATTSARLRTPDVRPIDLRKTYAPKHTPARRPITADKQEAETGRIVTRSTRGAVTRRPTTHKRNVAPVAAPVTPKAAAPSATTTIVEPVRAPRPRPSTGAGTVPPDPAAPAIPRGPGAIRRLDTPGCLDGT